MNKHYYTYITTNKRNTVFYTGITNNLKRRIFEHKNKLVKGFTKKYNIDKLVYYQEFNNSQEAIAAEKQIKAGSRKKKIDLIESMNLEFRDLANEF